MSVSHLYVFGEMSVQVFFPLFDWVVFLVLSCMSCLYILEINTLLVVSFAIILYHSEGFLFTLFIVSFALQELSSLIRFHLFTFIFLSITLGGGSQGILILLMSSSVLPMFSSKSFIRSGQISRSVVSDSLRPHESQHARPPCPSPIPAVHSDSCPSSQ